MIHAIATNRFWNISMKKELEKRTDCSFRLIGKREDLSLKTLLRMKPKYIFFPHWSYIIPEDIFTNFECVIFHMTDVPFGRGGSPLQNLIERGIYQTKISALRCVEEIDAGPVYLKRKLDLHGSAEEIFIRAARVMEDMIVEIVEKMPDPVEQAGKVVTFERRRPEQGNIENLGSLEKVFDYIRMLDAEGYPKAFLEAGKFKFEFSRAKLKREHIIADVKVFYKGNAE